VSTSDASSTKTDPWSLGPPRQKLQIEHNPETVQQIIKYKLTPLHSYPQQTFTTKLTSWAYPVEETTDKYPPEKDRSTANQGKFFAPQKEVSLQVGPSALPNAYLTTPNVFTCYVKVANYAPSNYRSH